MRAAVEIHAKQGDVLHTGARGTTLTEVLLKLGPNILEAMEQDFSWTDDQYDLTQDWEKVTITIHRHE